VPYAVEAKPRAYVIRCPAAYNAPVVSTMTSCINDVNSAARFGEQTKGAARKPYGLYQGQTVDETGPDGRSRRVRILPPAF
jgi:hypothetical protein